MHTKTKSLQTDEGISPQNFLNPVSIFLLQHRNYINASERLFLTDLQSVTARKREKTLVLTESSALYGY